ncbi:MAG: hypothetical protein HOM21_11315, partial [Halobacteriovoraceae bacterium]|nr:hypothetical protein [Halobacteriovoraceae bacterium]
MLLIFLLVTGSRTLFAKEYDDLAFGTLSRSLEARMNACMGKNGVINHQTLRVHSHFHRHPEVKAKREKIIAALKAEGKSEKEIDQVIEVTDLFHGKHKEDFQQGYMNYFVDCRELTAMRYRMMESELQSSQKEKVYNCLREQGWDQSAIDGLLGNFASSIKPKL